MTGVNADLPPRQIDNADIINAVHTRRAPVIPVDRSLRYEHGCRSASEAKPEAVGVALPAGRRTGG
jgi:hypothetical protein